MPESSGERSGLIKVGGLWTNTDKHGDKYLQGKLSYSCRLLAFRNRFKRAGTSEPDYMMMAEEKLNRVKYAVGR